MCLGNRAESSAHYINSQLVAQWENAQRCAHRHGTGLKPIHSEVEYGTCLYEFYGPGKHHRQHPCKEDLAFYATFGAPRIEFVCNHEVILFLDVQDGHCKVDAAKGSSKHGHHEHIANYTFAFRLNFNTHSIEQVHCRHIGNNSAAYTMNLLILDTNSASFCPELSNVHEIQDRKLHALIYYLSKSYLSTLKRAGYHVLHSLPDFDNISSTSAYIDYSAISRHTLSTAELFGFSIEDVNVYLKGLWLQAAEHIDEHGERPEHASEYYLAEHRSAWDTVEDVNFHISFGPMQIQALCKREVVVYLDLQDVHFHLGGSFHEEAQHRYSNWKVAILVDIVFEETEAGCVKRIKLDLSTARFCEPLSIMEAECHDTELLIRMKTSLIRYITRYYLTIIETAGHTCIFHKDTRITARDSYDTFGSASDQDEGEEENDGCDCEDERSCGHELAEGGIRWQGLARDRVETFRAGEFDVVTAVTQGSINAHFKAMWEIAHKKITALGSRLSTWSLSEREIQPCLAEYSVLHANHGEEVFFQASFGAPQIQLVCEEGSRSVILYLHLRDGYLKTLDSQRRLCSSGDEHSFSDWCVAFTVDLKLQECPEEHKVSKSVLGRLGSHGHHGFQQLVLDFSTTKLCLAKSTMPGLMDEDDYRLIRSKRVALATYLTTYYLPTLARAGHHVLHTIPLSSTTHDAHATTSLTFQIHPFNVGSHGSLTTVPRREIVERNMIVFLGMTDHRPLPPGPLAHSGNWVVGRGRRVPQGAVCLSRKTFLEGRLLRVLALINRDTTVLPAFSGVDDGEWILKLTTWEKHEIKRKRACGWKEIASRTAGALEFEWRNRDEWGYEHEGDDGSNGLYTVRCTTHNTLTIPMAHKQGTSSILVHGNVNLVLTYAGARKNWSSEMTATWSAAINLSSDARNGIKVHVSPSKIVPNFHSSHTHGALGHSTFASAFAQLKQQLPSVIEFGDVIEELKGVFEGVWPHLHVASKELVVTNPIFNRRGDLLLELTARGDERPALKHRISRQTLQHVEESWFRNYTHRVGGVLHSTVSSPAMSSRSGSSRSVSSASVVTPHPLYSPDVLLLSPPARANPVAVISKAEVYHDDEHAAASDVDSGISGGESDDDEDDV